MSMQVILSGVEAVLRDIERTARAVEKDAARAMYRIGATVKDLAQEEYAPISPTERILKSMRKTKRRGKRKASSTTRPKPGSLRNSIQFTANAKQVDIYVPSNSPAGKYAAKIHDEKGKSWRNRGPGTKKAGPKADDKFISRAIKDSEREIEIILEDQLGRSLPR